MPRGGSGWLSMTRGQRGAGLLAALVLGAESLADGTAGEGKRFGPRSAIVVDAWLAFTDISNPSVTQTDWSVSVNVDEVWVPHPPSSSRKHHSASDFSTRTVFISYARVMNFTFIKIGTLSLPPALSTSFPRGELELQLPLLFMLETLEPGPCGPSRAICKGFG